MQNNLLIKCFFKLICFFILVFVLVFIDQFLSYGIRLGGGFYLCNSGISFGLLVPSVVFWLVLAIFFLLFLFFIYKKGSFSYLFTLGLALFISGALSNIADRFLLGCVVDYIMLFKNIFPIFNLADVEIFLGSCFVFLSLLPKTFFKSE